MLSIGMRELRQYASRYVAMVKQGQRVAVTDRGKLVAYLVPAGDSSPILDRLVAAGVYLPPTGSILDIPDPPTVPPGKRPLSEVVAELRDSEPW